MSNISLNECWRTGKLKHIWSETKQNVNYLFRIHPKYSEGGHIKINTYRLSFCLLFRHILFENVTLQATSDTRGRGLGLVCYLDWTEEQNYINMNIYQPAFIKCGTLCYPSVNYY